MARSWLGRDAGQGDGALNKLVKHRLPLLPCLTEIRPLTGAAADCRASRRASSRRTPTSGSTMATPGRSPAPRPPTRSASTAPWTTSSGPPVRGSGPLQSLLYFRLHGLTMMALMVSYVEPTCLWMSGLDVCSAVCSPGIKHMHNPVRLLLGTTDGRWWSACLAAQG